LTDITFVRTGHYYEQYDDFFKLVELAEFPIIQLSEVDVSQEGVFILSPMNGEWEPHISNQSAKRRNAYFIMWLLERPSGDAGAVGGMARRQWNLIGDRFFDEIWVSDRQLATETGLRYVTLGSNIGLGDPNVPEKDKKYDFCHISYENPRRQTIYKDFKNIGPNCWGEERHHVLRFSRFGVATHQDQFPFVEPLRMSIFASYALPVMSEMLKDSYPYGDTILTANYIDLPKAIRQMLSQNYSQEQARGQKFHKLMTEEFEFGKVVRQAINQDGLRWR
jgi:hypothetical protein